MFMNLFNINSEYLINPDEILHYLESAQTNTALHYQTAHIAFRRNKVSPRGDVPPSLFSQFNKSYVLHRSPFNAEGYNFTYWITAACQLMKDGRALSLQSALDKASLKHKTTLEKTIEQLKNRTQKLERLVIDRQLMFQNITKLTRRVETNYLHAEILSRVQDDSVTTQLKALEKQRAILNRTLKSLNKDLVKKTQQTEVFESLVKEIKTTQRQLNWLQVLPEKICDELLKLLHCQKFNLKLCCKNKDFIPWEEDINSLSESKTADYPDRVSCMLFGEPGPAYGFPCSLSSNDYKKDSKDETNDQIKQPKALRPTNRSIKNYKTKSPYVSNYYLFTVDENAKENLENINPSKKQEWK